MAVYYNEFDPFAVKWLRELIKQGHIADGIVDDRSILDVEAKDLEGFTQHHFFAGIGGWSAALRLAGWADNRQICTASLPCQPFSVAGQNLGKNDERHLLPHFMQLVRQYGKFDTIMGEQVEGSIRHGWVDDLQTNMAAEEYTTGAVVLGAHSVSAPHKRQRLYWICERLENSLGERRCGWDVRCDESNQRGFESKDEATRPCNTSCVSMADSCSCRCKGQRTLGRPLHTEKGGERQDNRTIYVDWLDSRIVKCRDGKYRPIPTQPEIFPLANGVSNRVGTLRGAGNAIVPQVAAEVIKAYMGV